MPQPKNRIVENSSFAFARLSLLMLILSLVAGLALSPRSLASDPITHLEMVKDINSGSGDGGITSAHYASLGNVMFFLSDDGTHGVELWKTDGTSGGTSLVKDINSGSSSSSPTYIKAINGVVVFSANDGSKTSLWKTDGTESGTTILSDIYPAGSATPAFMTVMGSELYFMANDGTHGYELWKTDGTSGGTSLVKDINSGSGDGLSTTYFSFMKPFTVYDNELYFPANDGTHGVELWKTDGTSGGTSLVKDINSGSGDSISGFYLSLVSLDNGIMFIATNGTDGYEPWFSDGTTLGTIMPVNINTGGDSMSFFGKIYTFDGQAIFKATDDTNGAEPWVSDGTTVGTSMIKDINSGSGSSSPDNFMDFGSYSYFQATDGTNGVELWRTDGTSSGTTLVKDINAAGDSYPVPTAVVSGKLLLVASTDGTNFELWGTDGTGSGTAQLSDIYSGGNAIAVVIFGVVGDKYYFSANDGTHGSELWTYWVETPSEPGPDTNGDGTDDSEQLYVDSFTSTVTGKTAVLEVDDTCEVDSANASSESAQATTDSGYDYPAGLMNFNVTCTDPGSTITVTQYFYDLSSSDLIARKYNSESGGYATIEEATITETTIDSHTVTKVSYQVTDGGELDEDGIVNGVIVDPSGPATSVVGTPNTGLLRLN